MRLASAALCVALASTPALAQFDARAIDTTLARVASGDRLPAVGIVVVQNGRVIHQQVAGFSDLEHGVRASDSTRFDVASIAKQFTAYAVSLLASANKIELDASVRRYLPELDGGGVDPSVRHLIHHTAGIEDTDGLFALSGGRYGDVPTHNDLLALLLRHASTRFLPGEQHAYSNGGYTLLAEVVQRISGRSFEEFTDSAIFRPLGMRSSGFVRGAYGIIPNRALPYVRDVRTRTMRASTNDMYPGAGGLFATLPDMASWMIHLLAPQRDSAATMRLRERGRLSDGSVINYAWGLGWGLHRGVTTLRHSGSGPATASQLLLAPALGIGVFATTAGEVDVDPSALAIRALEAAVGAERLAPVVTPPSGTMMLMITEAELNQRPPESRGVIVPLDLLREYEGTYRFPDRSIIVVRINGEQLEMAPAGRQPWRPLFPLADGRFVSVPLWDVFRFGGVKGSPAIEMVRDTSVRSRRRVTVPSAGARLPETGIDSVRAKRYTGYYASVPLRAVYEVVFEDNQLVLRHARHGDLRLIPLGGANYGVDSPEIVGLTFAESTNGAVGLELEARSWGTRAAFVRIPAQ